VTQIETVVRDINRELSQHFEKRLRAALVDQDREWLVDQIVRLMLEERGFTEARRFDETVAKVAASRQERANRVDRIRSLGLNRRAVERFASEHGDITRESLIADGFVLPGAPAKGTSSLTLRDRSASGEALLQQAKDVVFALLFGDESTGTVLRRNQQELLTLVLPRAKAEALDFMQASTKLAATGTWQDPSNVSNDDQIDNVLIEVQYGDIAEESVGDAIIAALKLINNLEINEQVLYANMINIEQGSLID
jgi:hypothetical protein